MVSILCPPTERLLRACGGLPDTEHVHLSRLEPTPRMRRSTRGDDGDREWLYAYSAHAEVYPAARAAGSSQASLLRACGGLPIDGERYSPTGMPTPRMRRSTLRDEITRVDRVAYSAHAEVYPTRSMLVSTEKGLLRACGGLPNGVSRWNARTLPTPRMRRSTRA